MAQGDPEKWNMPGWRIEQRYANKCLIGNWSEERRQFTKGTTPSNSTHRTDFRHFRTQVPDVSLRRKAQFKHAGLPKDMIFSHHGNRYSNNMITWYDEHYNGRYTEANLPEIRNWDGNRLAWLPERTDHPIQGAPTNYGLLQLKMHEWQDQANENRRSDLHSTYMRDYYPQSARVVRHAGSKESSTTLEPTNKSAKNWDLRDRAYLRQPEQMRSEIPAI